MFRPSPNHLRNGLMADDSMILAADVLHSLYSAGGMEEAAGQMKVQGPDGQERTLTYPSNDVLGSYRRYIEHFPTIAPPRDTNPPPEMESVQGQELCERCAKLSLDPLPNPIDIPPQDFDVQDHEEHEQHGEHGEHGERGERGEDEEDEEDARVKWYVMVEATTDTVTAVNTRTVMISEVADKGSIPCHRNTIQGKLADLGQYPDDFSTASCPFCNAFAAVRTRLLPSPHGHPNWSFELNALSATFVNFETSGETKHSNNIGPLLAGRRLEDTTILAVDPKPPHVYYPMREGISLREHSGSSGHLYPVITVNEKNRRFSGRQIATDAIDYNILSSWINACRKYHPTGCGNLKKLSARDIPGFKVMDTSTEKVVPLPKDQGYAALSYVWGTKVPEIGFPKVVQDAFAVCRNLGVCYLWVDRYCIDQSDGPQTTPDKRKETQNQLASMHIIYEAAEFTIIACAGQDANFGLPGVSSRSRFRQPSIKIGETLYVSSLPSLRSLLEHIKWNERGWTHQEGILSTRRLIFTEYQVYFECNHSHCTEAVFAPDDIFFRYTAVFRYGQDGWGWPAMYGEAAQSERNFPMAMSLNKGLTVFGLIEAYMARSLTYDGDTLNGMLGILSRGSTTKPPFGHFWGLPIFTTLPYENTPRDDLHQNATSGLLLAMNWTTKAPAVRNPKFPSWSWAGWKGPLELRFDRRLRDKYRGGKSSPHGDKATSKPLLSAFPNVKIEVEVMNEAGHWMQQCFDDFYADHMARPNRIIPQTRKHIHLEGLATTIKFSPHPVEPGEDPMHLEEEHQLYFEAFSNETEVILGYFTPTFDERREVLLNDAWHAVIFKHDSEEMPFGIEEVNGEMNIDFNSLIERGVQNLLLIVLRRVDAEDDLDLYERLGAARIAMPSGEATKGRLKVQRGMFRIQ